MMELSVLMHFAYLGLDDSYWMQQSDRPLYRGTIGQSTKCILAKAVNQ
jgi:hypothetical protein